MPPDPKTLAQQAQALKALGRLGEAIETLRQAVALAPASAAAEHNLAAALGDAGRWTEADKHIQRAFAKGANAPESWLVLARCRQALGALDAAETAFLAALERRPTFPDAHLDLAQLRWMLRGDAASALMAVDDAIARHGNDPRLRLVRAKILENTGASAAAAVEVGTILKQHPEDVTALVLAAQLGAAHGDAAEAQALADRAARLAPNDNVVAVTVITAHLAAGDADRAATEALQLLQRAPYDQHAIALLSTAWRILDDPRHRALNDYPAIVRTYGLASPPGWSSLETYIRDLAEALRAEHVAVTHPFGQSIRHGSQVSDILSLKHPAIAALPQALAPAIGRYLEDIGPGADPLRRRNHGAFAYQGMWSIRMRSGGYHVDHVHPKGWISSACYIEVPKDTPGEEGWIRFGAPGVRTRPPLEAEHVVRPEPGMLVLFPSYMWHGVNPYGGEGARMTIAFDLEPAAPGAARPT